MIELKQVSFTYQGQEHDGLRDIDLTIADGECVLLCGRSGCGKTTITRLVNGLIPQFYQGELQGRVLVDGQEISSLPMYQIAAKVGSVFQNPRTQFFNVDTDSEIAFGIENEARPPRELAERMIDELEIATPGVDTPVGRLSGGNVQKVLLGREIACNPSVLIVAYPVRGLDINSSYRIYDFLNEQKKKGVAVIFIGEDLDVLMQLSDRILVMCGGKVSGIVDPRKVTKDEIGLLMIHVEHLDEEVQA